MNKDKTQSGSAHLIIILILGLALLGSLGFVFYQNFIQNKDSLSNTETEKTNDESKTTTPVAAIQTAPINDPKTVVSEFVESYLDYVSHQDGTASAFIHQSPVVTDSFIDYIDEQSTMPAVSDIILFIQTDPVSYDVGDAETDGTISDVLVTFNYGSGESNTLFTLNLIENEWKIDSNFRGLARSF